MREWSEVSLQRVFSCRSGEGCERVNSAESQGEERDEGEKGGASDLSAMWVSIRWRVL